MDIRFTKIPVPNTSMLTLYSKLLHSQIQVQIYHRQCLNLAEHVHYSDYYTGIVDLIDELIEVTQGKTLTIIKNYESYSLMNYESKESSISYFKELINTINTYRLTLSKDYDNINNQLQVIIDLIEKTLYKLTFLP